MKLHSGLFWALASLLLSASTVQAQDSKYQFTITAGTGFSMGLDNLKKPGYVAQLYAEKFYNDDDTKTWWLTVGYLQQNPKASITEPDGPGGAFTKTSHFHKATVKTVTFGARKYYDSGIVLGGGMGAGFYAQINTTYSYSDPDKLYNRFEEQISNLGIGHIAQIGYKPNKVQILFTANSLWVPFHTTQDIDYEVEAPTFLPVLALSVGYTF